jgi:4a-hydroxytetrahydrobiopterin dehydratase
LTSITGALAGFALYCAPAKAPATCMTELSKQLCRPLKGEEHRVSAAQSAELLAQVASWRIEDAALQRDFRFADFHQTMAFVNALAWVAHQQDHHPDLSVGYNYCRVLFTTHDVGGLSLNDFICAARVDALQH